jgi:hypothetical protein
MHTIVHTHRILELYMQILAGRRARVCERACTFASAHLLEHTFIPERKKPAALGIIEL